MRLMWLIAFLSATFSFHNVYADTRCESVDVSQRVLGFCRTPLFKRYVATTAVGFHSEVGQMIDMLVPRADNPQIKRACMLQIDGSNVPCDTVWYISFKDGAQSIQFNRGSGQNPIFSFFGKHRDVDIISIDGIAMKVGFLVLLSMHSPLALACARAYVLALARIRFRGTRDAVH